MKMKERCRTTGEDYKSVVASVKGSVEAKLLENLCHYILKSTVEKVTDTNILDEVNKRCGTPMNERLPDVRELIKSKLKVDMKKDDVQARILKYFSDFNAIVDDNGLQTKPVISRKAVLNQTQLLNQYNVSARGAMTIVIVLNSLALPTRPIHFIAIIVTIHMSMRHISID
ncbi:hypothetical protein PsorP6_017743 [Peronosclerospora sorghi]|uniref:Uncharacterized protein n=1 Tax=Peronosclerospora sorghi TaxID=230839 RepID=A0ACC0WMV4_9STRA|nr:hypothetical protein PsorP6_017743 [Peronosclerospora sorghi]